MAFNKYPNSGSMFVRDKRNPKAADYGGDFTLDEEVLDYVLRQAERGQPVKLDISGWQRQGRNNTRFISLKVELPFQERQQNNGPRMQPRQQQSRGGYTDQSGRGPTMTSRGQYPQRDYGAGPQTRGTPQNERMRQELNDEIPFGNNDKAPWE